MYLNNEVFNFCCVHLMAHAVTKLFKVKKKKYFFDENGFYYDFIIENKNISQNEIKQIEDKMKEISNKNIKIQINKKNMENVLKILKNEALEIKTNHEYFNLYNQDDYFDISYDYENIPISSTKTIKNFCLLSVSGVDNENIQRIHGKCFQTQQQLLDFKNFLEEVKKRDHRNLGNILSLFFFEKRTGQAVFLPHGEIIKKKLENFSRKISKNFQEISSPQILSIDLWKKSGHFDHYKQNIYCIGDNLAIKPMNCPGAAMFFNNQIVSHKMLPMRVSEIGIVHRKEFSGSRHGLCRQMKFTIDDAHIFVKKTQIEKEILKLIYLIDDVYTKIFDFKYRIELSTMPNNKDTKIVKKLEEIIKKSKIEYQISEGEGAFYGHKIDFVIQDSLNRDWQCGTIQLDYKMSKNFDLKYIDNNCKEKKPVVIHRAIFGSFERFIAILLEHYNGNLPFWLSPRQLTIININKNCEKFCKKLKEKFQKENINVEYDNTEKTLSNKIRNIYMKKSSSYLIVGEEEIKTKTFTINFVEKNEKFKGKIKNIIKKISEKCQINSEGERI